MMKGYIVSNQADTLEELRSLPQYKELFFTLVWKNLHLQYQSVILGLLWGILSPLLMSSIFYFALNSRVGVDFSNYFIFLYSGFIYWNVFTSSLGQSTNCILQDHSMLKKVYFPRFILPLSFIVAKYFDLIIAFAILTTMLMFSDINVGWMTYLLVSVFSFFSLSLVSAGFCMIFSVLSVRFRGLQVIYPIIVQSVFFTSSVVYDSRLTIENDLINFIFQMNPITMILKPLRQAIFSGEMVFTSLLGTLACSLGICLVGFVCFKLEDKTLIERL